MGTYVSQKPTSVAEDLGADALEVSELTRTDTLPWEVSAVTEWMEPAGHPHVWGVKGWRVPRQRWGLGWMQL